MLLTTPAKVKAIKTLVREKNYDEALEIAEKINPAKVASVYDLSVIAEVYMKKGRLDDAKELYVEMYGRNKTHKVMTGLIEICLKLKEPKEAEQYLREFRRMEPDNPERLVYRYRVDSMLGKEPEFLIKSLAKLKNEEYTDVWALELAKAYYKDNDWEACAKECHQILKYFPDSEVAQKARVLLDACETEEEEPLDEILPKEEEAAEAESMESLMEDVSALLEESARAEAVANEVVEEKSIEKAVTASAEPYLRTPEFLSIHEPAGEDKSVFDDDDDEEYEEEAEEETNDELAAAAASYVIPESLAGKIDRIIYDDDDDDDDDEGFIDDAAMSSEEVVDLQVAVATAVEAVNADLAENAATAAEESDAEEAVETEDETDEIDETEEESDEVEESDEADEEEADDDEADEDEADADEEDADEESEEDEDDTDEELADDIEDDGFDDDDLEEELEEDLDEDDEDEDEESDDDSDEEEDEDDDDSDEDDDDEDDSDDADDDTVDDADSEEEDDEECDEENFPDEESDDEDTEVVIAESDYADAELEAVAERIGSEVCTAAEEAKGLGAAVEDDDSDEKKMADTQVVPFVREKQEIPDEDMEKMLYNLLKDIGGKDTK